MEGAIDDCGEDDVSNVADGDMNGKGDAEGADDIEGDVEGGDMDFEGNMDGREDAEGADDAEGGLRGDGDISPVVQT